MVVNLLLDVLQKVLKSILPIVSEVFPLAMLMVAVFPLFVSKAFPLEMCVVVSLLLAILQKALKSVLLIVSMVFLLFLQVRLRSVAWYEYLMLMTYCCLMLNCLYSVVVHLPEVIHVILPLNFYRVLEYPHD